MTEENREAVLARIAELEAHNARLAAENEALSKGSVPERVEDEPPHRPFIDRTGWIVLGGVLLLLAIVGALERAP
jgi:hypothetical protein